MQNRECSVCCVALQASARRRLVTAASESADGRRVTEASDVALLDEQRGTLLAAEQPNAPSVTPLAAAQPAPLNEPTASPLCALC